GEGRNYCMNAKNSTLKKIDKMQDVIFVHRDYKALSIPEGAMVYCDIPYKNSTGYSSGDFNHNQFYSWAEDKAKNGYEIYVSEYEHNVPDSWSVVWRKDSKKDIRDKNGVQQKTV